MAANRKMSSSSRFSIQSPPQKGEKAFLSGTKRDVRNPENKLINLGGMEHLDAIDNKLIVSKDSPGVSAGSFDVKRNKIHALPRINGNLNMPHNNRVVTNRPLKASNLPLETKRTFCPVGRGSGLKSKLQSRELVLKSKGAGALNRKTERASTVLESRALVPRHQYTIKPVIPAKKAELLDVAKAMHRDQFATRVKKLFDPERDAALQAIETGLYIGWRCDGNDFDCIRVSTESRCFCGHTLNDHESFKVRRSQNLKCQNCPCKKFAFIPSRPQEIGEWWLQKRRGFDVSTWRAKCRCKHTHEEHSPNNNKKCNTKGCTCFSFDSNFLCAACDKHWEEHDTCFDDINSRQQKGLPYGEEYLPFHELPQLRNIVLTGTEDDDSQYDQLVSGEYAIPRPQPTNLALQLQGKKRRPLQTEH